VSRRGDRIRGYVSTLRKNNLNILLNSHSCYQIGLADLLIRPAMFVKSCYSVALSRTGFGVEVAKPLRLAFGRASARPF